MWVFNGLREIPQSWGDLERVTFVVEAILELEVR